MTVVSWRDRDPKIVRRQALASAHADQELRIALIRARLDSGMTQRDVAEALGVSQAAVSQFERYDNDPHLSTVRRYALAVGAAVAHRVTDAQGQSVECGSWSMTWEPQASAESRSSEASGGVSGTMALPAPEVKSTDFALAS